MHRALAATLVLIGLQGRPLLVPPVEAGYAQATGVRSRITVTLPKQDAELLVNNTPLSSAGEAVIRTFESALLESGKVYTYKFTARWSPNTYTVITRNKTAQFRGGDAVSIDLTQDDPSDRARIRYVPTPDEIVAEMIALAGVKANDVVFEPGCGDARITIAAVKAGARRGVGIDIDPERVAESKRNVEAAGLGKSIDIRLGDALDIRDLSDASVVFMYMGDEFGRLMRPLLVRQLKVGTRIVSHRFTLGDWQPDQTVTVTDLGIPYVLHLWTVTQEVKDRAAAVVTQSPERGSFAEWRYFGSDKGFTRYSALDQITRDNVKDLRIVWRRPAVSDKLMQAFPELRPNAYLRSTPIMVDGVLYTQDAHGLVVALDGETGKTIWEQQPFAPTREEANGAATRGVDYWRDGAGNVDKRIFAIRGEYLYAVNADTGKLVPGFGDQGRTSLHFQENQPLAARFADSTGPLVVGNVVVVTGNTAGAGDGGNRKEAAPEDVRAFNAENGEHLWTFHVVPRAGEFGSDTWGNDSWKVAGDLGAWNPMTADEELGLVYIPLTAPTAAWYGGWRPGDNLFANTLVALDVKTGKRVWHFQTVHHDLWDFDNIGPPMLGDITVNGRRIKAVMQANKAAFLFVLDRTNGQPVWPIEERPVPQSTVPGEHSSPTQPIPTKPPAFALQGITDNDLIDYTPELKARAREIIRDYVIGPVYTPPSVHSDEPGGKKGTLVQPGAWGSANWNTGAFDPETAIYYAVSQTMGPANRSVRKQTGAGATMDYADVAGAGGRGGPPDDGQAGRGGQPGQQQVSQAPPSGEAVHSRVRRGKGPRSRVCRAGASLRGPGNEPIESATALATMKFVGAR